MLIRLLANEHYLLLKIRSIVYPWILLALFIKVQGLKQLR
jgi:hypothetical protein